MGFNKFTRKDGTILCDLTTDTITADKLAKGYTAHDKSGNIIVGTYEPEGGGTSSGGSESEEWIGDGNTHIWIHLEEGRTSPMMGVCPNGTVTVNWGDGTPSDVLTGSSTSTAVWTPNHNYASAGEYVITLTVDGEMGIVGDSYYGENILRHSSAGDNRNYAYSNAVQKVEIGNSGTSIGKYAFIVCYSLASISIPDGVTSIGDSAFSSCYSLASISIPASVTSIGSNAFNNCQSLASISIPDSVTSIGGGAISYCHSLAKIRFDGTTPPTVANSNAFNKIPTDCIISVPVGCLETYKTATNYPNSSIYTYVEE